MMRLNRVLREAFKGRGKASSRLYGGRKRLRLEPLEERRLLSLTSTAPAPYPTATHTAAPNFSLGNLVDINDGVRFDTVLAPALKGACTVAVSEEGRLDAWIDVNDDGVFHASEQLNFTDAQGIPVTQLAAGTHQLLFQMPAGALPTAETYARFRLSKAGGLGPDGAAPDGEVEDYAVAIVGSMPATSVGLSAASDTGIALSPSTFSDRITSVATPTLIGTAAAGSTVSLYAEAGGPLVLLGQTLVPGTDPAQTGNWSITSSLDLNDPTFTNTLGMDGARTLLAIAQDAAGNFSEWAVTNMFLATVAPRVSSVTFSSNGQDVFGRTGGGPGPLVEAIDITFVSDAVRTADFVGFSAVNFILADEVANYEVSGRATGPITIDHVDYFDATEAGGPGISIARVFLGEPLPDDLFTLTIRDAILDDAGNALDGEAFEDFGGAQTIILPSGDGTAGGEFVAGFFMDGLAEIAVARSGGVEVDLNGNFVFEAGSAGSANPDMIFPFARPSDVVFCGNFTGTAGGVADGFDKLAAYGRENGVWRWLIDTDNDGQADLRVVDLKKINGLPVAGNFDNNLSNGDEVGIFDGKTWWLDTNHDFKVDKAVASKIKGLPIVGDFNGDGIDDFATWDADKFYFDMTSSGGGIRKIAFGFPGVRERPVVTDFDHDGIDDVALWYPDRNGISVKKSAEWYVMLSGFTPVYEQAALVPLDFKFGSSVGVPLAGNFSGMGAPSSALASRAAKTVSGTSANDTFELTAGTAPGTWTLKVNGKAQTLDASTTTLNLSGLGGTNKVVINGRGANETAELWPDHMIFRSGSLTVTASRVSNVLVNGGGSGEVLFHDSRGDDNYTASPGAAKMTGSGFALEARNFANYRASSTAGGFDIARLHRTSPAAALASKSTLAAATVPAGKETLKSAGQFVVLANKAVSKRADTFGRVAVYSEAGKMEKVYAFKPVPKANPVASTAAKKTTTAVPTTTKKAATTTKTTTTSAVKSTAVAATTQLPVKQPAKQTVQQPAAQGVDALFARYFGLK